MTDRRLSMILLAVLVVSAMAVPVVALAVVPERLVTKVLELPWATIWPILVPLLTGAGAAVWSFFVAPVTAKEEPVRPTRVPPSRQGGHAAIDTLLFIAAMWCAWVLHGCGASALRAHVQTADAFHLAVETAGPTIEQACALDLSTCATGDEVCISQVERRCVTAAAARDALIVPVTVYRSLALSTAGIDPNVEPIVIPDALPDPDPSVMNALAAAGSAAMRGMPTLTAAIAALTGGGQ
jgi:hypothetical protein